MRFAGLASIVLLTSLVGFRARAQLEREDGTTTLSSRRSMPAADDAELGRTARLQTILRVALDRNRDVAENQARASAAEARGQAASRLPDLELKYEQWGVPLSRPYDLGSAQTLMIGVKQTFPAWDPRCARSRGGRRSRQRARHVARPPPGGRRAGPTDIRDLLQGRPGAAVASRARRPDFTRSGAGSSQPAHGSR
jgi:hypothetical protein